MRSPDSCLITWATLELPSHKGCKFAYELNTQASINTSLESRDKWEFINSA